MTFKITKPCLVRITSVTSPFFMAKVWSSILWQGAALEEAEIAALGCGGPVRIFLATSSKRRAFSDLRQQVVCFGLPRRLVWDLPAALARRPFFGGDQDFAEL